jgi:hypothetical protein
MNHSTLQDPAGDGATTTTSAAAPGATGRRRRLGRLAKLMTIGAALASLGGGLLAQPAAAARITSTGTIGYVGLPTGKCTFYPNWDRLDVTVASPSIYAPNVRAGSGNDSAWVRYQVFVIDSNMNLVRQSTVSSWVAASDNRAAAFTGSSLTFTGIPNLSTVWIWVEFYGYGSAIYNLDSYQIQVAGLSPNGPADSCAKYTPPTYRWG